jgi:hypothetical protein
MCSLFQDFAGFSPLHTRVKPHAPFNRSEGYRLSELDLMAQICSLPLCSPALPGCETSTVQIFSSARSDDSCSSSLSLHSFFLNLEDFKCPKGLSLCFLYYEAYILLGSRPPELLELKPSKGFSPPSLQLGTVKP